MQNVLEHPDVTRTRQWGYPRAERQLLTPVGYCGGCKDAIMADECRIEWEDEVFCDSVCLINGIGAVRVE